MDESQIYQQALIQAKEQLARWEELGRSLGNERSVAWENVRARREEEVGQLETLIQRAKNRL